MWLQMCEKRECGKAWYEAIVVGLYLYDNVCTIIRENDEQKNRTITS